MVRAELRQKMLRAEAGLLHLQRGSASGYAHEVTQLARDDRILELRLDDRQERPPGTSGLKMRLYYTEPAHEHGCLLYLLLEPKPPGLGGLYDQDRHIDIASERLHNHYN